MAACRRRVVCLLLSLLIFVDLSLCNDKHKEHLDDSLKRVKRVPPRADVEKLPMKARALDNVLDGKSFVDDKPVQYHLQAPKFDQVGGQDIKANDDPVPYSDPKAGILRAGSRAGALHGKQDLLQPGAVRELGNVPRKPKRPSKIKIATSDECAADVLKFCSKGVKDNNFYILDCLQNDEMTKDEVSLTCQNFLWKYKRDLTRDDRFDTTSNEMCATELKQIHECRELPEGQGLIIPCLIEHIENITAPSCHKFLNKMASIIFSDYRFIYRFAETCERDIEKLKCGRLPQMDDDAPHSQGRTVSCLAEQSDKLSAACNKQVLRVYELQADDYHMDRPLYYACQEDRENLCAETRAGNSAVFQCLFNHLGKPDLSEKCREKLELRQRLMAQDVRVEHTFYFKCRADIEKYDCLGGSTGHEDTKRAHVLLCLESAHMGESKVDPACIQEMMKVRQRLIEDYRINPDLIARCGDEIEKHCKGLEPGGNTMHCLMGLARNRKKKNMIRDECKSQLAMLLKEVNIVEDYRLDKPLQIACADVVTAVCSHVRPGEGAIINCLMDNIDEDDMTDLCEDRLLEIQYFMARDFRLDPDLYQSCKRDANKLCHERGSWADPDATTPDQGPRVLACLHRHYRLHKDDKSVPALSRACIMSVQRVMRQRAHSVDLNPGIEDACMVELGDMCSEDKADVEKGAELECLQMNYEGLGPKCKAAIANFTEEESEDIHMDTILMKACTPMIKKFCEEELESEAEADEVLECLIENKHNADMQPKCAVGIEHHQLISLKDFRFNHKFKEACHKSVQTLCKRMTTKYEVVACLSEHVRNDTLLEKQHRVDQACRKQLRVEVLERGESIKLDPQLEEKCMEDVEKYCANISPGNAAVLECLKKNKNSLTKKCHKLIFKREKDEFAIGDYALMHTCKKMIRRYCDTYSTEPEILECLKREKDRDDFDEKCQRIVLQRQITQSKDFRLNPLLQKACHMDIPKFCSDVLVEAENDAKLEGKVINCLKKQFAIKRLSSSCEPQIRERVKAASLDIRLAPILLRACRQEIPLHCSKEMMGDAKDGVDSMRIAEVGHGTVIECLKTKFKQRKIEDMACRREIANLLAESHIDVNVDPLLQTACQKDLITLCKQITPGQGRQMSCLLSFLDEDPRSMTEHCRDMLSKRKEMWEYAAQVAPPESFGEIYDSIVTSPSKNYFLAVLFTVIGIIFIVGISCGRVTKRVKAELKNK